MKTSAPSRRRLLWIILIAVILGAGLMFLASARERAREADCRSRLRAIGFICALYAADHDGQPPQTLVDIQTYAGSTWITVCPSAPTPTAPSYAFTGVTNKWNDGANVVFLREIEPNHHGHRHLLSNDGRVELSPDH